MRRRPTWPRPGAGWAVALSVLFTLVLRLPFLTWPLMPDEAGLLIIGENWHQGRFLYGDFFVGRGVVALSVYALAGALDGAVALRLLGCVVAVGLVLAAAWAGQLLRGRQAAGWAAVVAAAYGSTYAFSAQVMNERLLAAALATASCACTLAAVRAANAPPRRQVAFAVLAGLTATGAVLVVQSYGEGVVFAAVLLVGCLRTGGLSRAAAVRIAAGGLLGVALPAAAMAATVALTWVTAGQVWFQMLGYRFHAVGVINRLGNPLNRLVVVAVIAALTGVLVVLACYLLSYRQLTRRRDTAPAWAATLATMVVAVVGMTLGGDWYSDYLLELVPTLVLATALVAPQPTRSGFGTRAAVLLACVAAVVANVLGQLKPVLGDSATEQALGQWVRAGAEPGDTALVVLGKANVLYATGMTTPYPYLWSLLTRTLDPDVHLLLSTLRGPDAPTWILEWYDIGSLELGRTDVLQRVVDARYVAVGAPCGFTVYLLRTKRRELPPSSACGEADLSPAAPPPDVIRRADSWPPAA